MHDDDEGQKEKTAWQRLHWPLANLFSGLLWLWLVTKAFIGDVDRWALASWDPGIVWLLDYRILLVLAVLAVVAVVAKPKQWWLFLFVALWPVVVALFYLPRFLIRRRSSTLALAVLHTAFGFLKGIRFALVTIALTASAVLGILLTAHQIWVLAPCALILVGVWAVLLLRIVMYSITPSSFIMEQRKLVASVFGSNISWAIVRVHDDLKQPGLERFTNEQTNSMLTTLSFALAFTRICQHWATLLENYRKSAAMTLFGCLAVITMFLQSGATFTLVNLAIFKARPEEFVATYPPTLATFVHYTFASAFYGEIAALAPKGPWATAAGLAMGLGSSLILLLLVVALILGFRQSRSDAAAAAAIEQMRIEADNYEHRLAVEYGLDEADALRARLIELRGGLVNVLPSLFRRQLPPGGDLT